MDKNSSEAETARNDAAKFRRWAWFWRANVPVVCITYWLMSKSAVSEKAVLVYLAAASIIALVVTYDGKAEAAEARAASYDNP